MKKLYSTIFFTIFFVAIVQGQSVDLSFGLQAYYPFSGNSNDESGNGNHGTIFGNPTLTTDRYGIPNSAFDFDGIDDYINTFSTFDFPQRTLSAWIKADDITGTGTDIKVAITQNSNNLNNGIMRIDFENGILDLWAGGLSSEYNHSGLSTNNWYHIVLIRDNSVTKYYLDGILVQTSISDGSGSTIDPNPELIIGSNRTESMMYFDGQIDDIRVYDRAINECEVNALFTGIENDINTGIIASYPFNNSADDVSGNGYHGTIYGAPNATTDRFGAPNSAYDFDGVDDYINTHSTFDYNDRTLSVWVNPDDITGTGATIKVAVTQNSNSLNNGIMRVDFENGLLDLWAGGFSSEYNHSGLTTNNWYHVVLVRNNGVSEYYLNGNLIYTGVTDGNGSTIDPNPEFIIGTNRTESMMYFDGKIDDIRIYNRALTSCEIDSLYNYDPYLSLNDLSDDNFTISPNPFNDQFVIDRSDSSPLQITIFNLNGKRIRSIKSYKTQEIVEASYLNPGVYIIQLEQQDQIIRRKIIKL